MTPEDVIDVLAKAAAFDQRTVGQADVLAWHEILHRIERDDALDAVAKHYAESRERLMPADVVRLGRIARLDRERAAKVRTSEPLALPSRFETDAERDFRLERGLAQCKTVLGPVFDMLAEKRRRRVEVIAPDVEEAS